MSSFTVSVPATLSNLGPGYDVLGLALDLKNRFKFTTLPQRGHFISSGRKVAAKSHLAFRTFVEAIHNFGGEYSGGLSLEQDEHVPRSRGLGSSATARVAGLMAYLKLVNPDLSVKDQVAFLAKAEGHPDNVTPALRGGLTLCGHEDDQLLHMVLPAPKLQVALCIPHKTVETNAARKILPANYPQSDIVFSTSRIAFLIAALLQDKPDMLEFAMKDVIHQPFRKTLIGPVDEAFAKAKDAGALSAFISGSGSTLAAFVSLDDNAEKVAQAMAEPFLSLGCDTKFVHTSEIGARIEP